MVLPMNAKTKIARRKRIKLKNPIVEKPVMMASSGKVIAPPRDRRYKRIKITNALTATSPTFMKSSWKKASSITERIQYYFYESKRNLEILSSCEHIISY
jgi:hypothetical protein